MISKKSKTVENDEQEMTSLRSLSNSQMYDDYPIHPYNNVYNNKRNKRESSKNYQWYDDRTTKRFRFRKECTISEEITEFTSLVLACARRRKMYARITQLRALNRTSKNTIDYTKSNDHTGKTTLPED